MEQKIITIGYGNVKKVQIGGNLPLAFVGGPCARKIETIHYLWQKLFPKFAIN